MNCALLQFTNPFTNWTHRVQGPLNLSVKQSYGKLKRTPFLQPFAKLVLITYIMSGPGKRVKLTDVTINRKIVFCSIKGEFINIFVL